MPPAPFPDISMLISITGMVGSGKTTLAQALATHLGARFVGEDVLPESNPWLNRFYGDTPGAKERYCFPLQLHFLLDRVEALRACERSGGLWVADQTLDVDYHVFVEGHRTSGLLGLDEYHLLRRTYQALADGGIPKPDLLICLRIPLDRALSRIAERNRTGETDVDVGYWARLYDRYTQIMDCARGLKWDLDVSDYDLIERPGDIGFLAERMQAYLDSRT